MDITFNCDKCGQSLTIDEARAGQLVDCAKCGARVTAPTRQQPDPLEMSFKEIELPELTALPDVSFSDADLRRMLDECATFEGLSPADIEQMSKDLLSPDSELNSILASSKAELDELMKGVDVDGLEWLLAQEKEPIPEPDPNLRAADVAAWMLEQVQAHGVLEQVRAAYHIRRHFGSRFIYLNRNSNPAISLDVLKEFLAISLPTVVWNRRERLWRTRRPNDPAGRRMVED